MGQEGIFDGLLVSLDNRIDQREHVVYTKCSPELKIMIATGVAARWCIDETQSTSHDAIVYYV